MTYCTLQRIGRVVKEIQSTMLVHTVCQVSAGCRYRSFLKRSYASQTNGENHGLYDTDRVCLRVSPVLPVHNLVHVMLYCCQYSSDKDEWFFKHKTR